MMTNSLLNPGISCREWGYILVHRTALLMVNTFRTGIIDLESVTEAGRCNVHRLVAKLQRLTRI